MQVATGLALLDEAATVPFIARYRKEATGGLDDVQLRLREERLCYLRELETRRQTILESISALCKLTDGLKASILCSKDKNHSGNLYSPYKLKRRTNAMIAREAGLESLADALLANSLLVPEVEAEKCLSIEPKTVGQDTASGDVKNALEGVRQILIARFSEDAGLLGRVRQYLYQHAVVESKLIAGQAEKGAAFANYFAYLQHWKSIPSHRAVAIFRGPDGAILRLNLRLDSQVGEQKPAGTAPFNAVEMLNAGFVSIADQRRPSGKCLTNVLRSM